jgi:hypothetical protein
LIEESRTNLVTYSDDFSNVAWAKVNVSVTPASTAAPDGTSNGSKLIANTASSAHFIQEAFTVSNATVYTFSIYAKQGEYSTIAIASSGGAATNQAVVNLTTGVVTGGTATTQSVGNGWWRISVPYTTNATTLTLNAYVINGTAFADRNTAGDGTSGIYIYGAQLEAGAFPTSYIPTSGATATRAADLASIPVSAFGYNQSEGTVVVEARNTENCDVLALIDDGSTNNRIRLYESGSNVVGLVSVNSTNVAVMVTLQSVAVDSLKSAIATKKDDFAVVANGGSVVSDTAGDMPSNLTDLQVATPEGGGANGAVHIKSIKYYPRRLSNAQLVELTS